MKIKYIILGILMTLLFSVNVHATTIETPSVQYQAHVSEIGWQSFVKDGETGGTTGQALPMEAINIKVSGVEGLGISYRAHVRNIGWQNFVSDGKTAGTTGQVLSMEAIEIKLTGEKSTQYDIYYSAHVANVGWLGWAKNGAPAGSSGYAYPMEAIKILIVKNGDVVPETIGDAYMTKNSNSVSSTTSSTSSSLSDYKVSYEVHVSDIGWMSTVYDGKTAGTVGKNLPMEAVKISTNIPGVDVAYSAHVSNIGWMNEVNNGAIAGTTGRVLPMEALKIWLTGDNAGNYDVYYRAHIADYGWLDWAKNGETSGSVGLAKTLQAIELKVVSKGSNAPGSTICPYIQAPTVIYKSYVDNSGWQEAVKNGSISGTTGKNLPLRAFTVALSGVKNLGIKYSAHVSDIGWLDYVSDDAVAGIINITNDIEAIRIQLTGSNAKYYDVWYRVHSTNLGWLGWARNGEMAGTASLAYDAQAIQIVIKIKGTSAPGDTSRAFVDTLEESYLWPAPGNYYITSYFGYRNQPTAGASTYHQGIDIDGETGDTIVATKSGIVTECAYNSTRGYYVTIRHDDGVETIYMHLSRYIVSEGMRVSRGQTIAYMGSTGVSTGSHLHFSLLINGSNVNPLDYVSR